MTTPSTGMQFGSPPLHRGRRPSTQWVAIGRGLHRPHHEDAFLADLRGWSEVLPVQGCFTHVTGLRAHRLWLPQLPAAAPVFASISAEQDRLRRPEIRTLRHTSPVRWDMVDGVPVASAAESVLVSGRDLGALDLTVVADGAVHRRACEVEELIGLSLTRRWGARALRRVIPLVDGRSESPWETVLRLFHRCADVPVEPQVDVLDADGRFVARADLLVRGRRWVHEYDGAHHRGALAHAEDLRRDRALSSLGYLRRGFTASDLTSRAASTMRELDDALARSPDPRRLARWRQLLDSSTLTGPGRRRLARRWGVGT